MGGFKIRGRLDLVDESAWAAPWATTTARSNATKAGNPFPLEQGKECVAKVRTAGLPWPALEDGTVAPGGIVPYSGGQGGMSEIIFTDRQQFAAAPRMPSGPANCAWPWTGQTQAGFLLHEHSLDKADQTQYYLEASTQQPLGATLRHRRPDLPL